MKTLLFTLLCVTFSALSLASANAQSSTVKAFIEPYRSIDVAAPELGTLSEVNVKEGQQVSKGDILARLNEAVLEAARQIAQDNSEAAGKLNSALAELNSKQDRYGKIQGLYQRRHASSVELEQAKSQLDIAAARVQTVRDEIHIKSMELTRISAQLNQRRLRSPIDGLVTRVYKDEGEFVLANDPKVVTVVQLNPLLIVFNVPQSKSLELNSGDVVDLMIGKDKVKTQGKVEFVSPTADAQSGTCRVKVRIENGDGRWRSGDVCYLPGIELEEVELEVAQELLNNRVLATSYQRLKSSQSLKTNK